MDLLCELLTDNPADGLNSIPFWMFSICYTFVAAFDCSSNDGRNRIAIEPSQINAQHFRLKLIDDWKECVKFTDRQDTSSSSSSSSSSISIDFDRIKQAMDFAEIVEALSKLPESDQFDENDTKADDLKNDDMKQKYKIIRRIGAPWDWIYQFVDHCSPLLRSYNFYECQHKLYNKEYDEYFDVSKCDDLDVSGAGPTISTQITDAFLHYAKANAQENDGIISLTQIKEHQDCPPML